jgi:hypothetical protein
MAKEPQPASAWAFAVGLSNLTLRENSALAEFFFEDLVLGAEIFDDFLLLAVAPAGQDGEQELPGLEDNVHGGADGAVATSIALGLEEGLSSAQMAEGQGAASSRPQWQLLLS